MAWIIVAACAALAALVAAATIAARRGLRDLQVDVESAWNELEGQLGKRQDHLARVLELCGRPLHDEGASIARAANAGSAVVAAAARRDASALAASLQSHRAAVRNLLAVASAHPQLASSTAFAALCARADELDARVDAAREHYNATASVLNLRRDAFPHNVLARVAGPAPAPILP